MNFVPHIATSITNSSYPWILLLIFVLFLVCEILQPHFVQDCFKALITRSERVFGDRSARFISKICLFAFKVMTLAYVLCLCKVHTAQETWLVYGRLLIVVLAFFVIRFIGYHVVNYTFELSQSYRINEHYYSSMELALCALLFPIAIVMTNLANTTIFSVIILLLVGIYILLYVTKTVRTFCDGIQSIIFVILYILTLEILPIGGIIWSGFHIC